MGFNGFDPEYHDGLNLTAKMCALVTVAASATLVAGVVLIVMMIRRFL